MIQIDNLRLKKFDALNWSIEQKHITRKGATTWTNIGYYSSLEIGTRNLFFKSIHEPDSIAELLQAIERAKQAITNALQRDRTDFK